MATKPAPTGRKASSAAGGTATSRVRDFFFGKPLAAMRRENARRKAGRLPQPKGLALFVSWFVGLTAVAFTVITALQVYITPNNPGWWAMLWLVGGLAVLIFGHVFGMFSRSGKHLTLMVTTYVLGFFAIPFVAQFMITMNLVVGIVAAIVVVPFLIAGGHYVRSCRLHNEGYQV